MWCVPLSIIVRWRPKNAGRLWRGLVPAGLMSLLGIALALGISLVKMLARPAGSAPARHVLVISIDGMRARSYTDPPRNVPLPNLQRLMKEGSYSSGVEGIYPTLTYPSHTTIVTGRQPAQHGIYTNLSSREPGRNTGDWFWFAKSIRVPTLWDEARRNHLSTASIAWPVTAGAAIDWDVPEIWDPRKGEKADLLYVVRYIRPLFSVELLRAMGLPKRGEGGDVSRVRLAAYLLKQHRPNLLLLHLASLDSAEHLHGPDSPAACEALSQLDVQVGKLLEAVKNAGLEATTDVFIVSDHGFLRVDRMIAPNMLLAKAGLLTANARGHVTGGRLETVSNGGSFFIYWNPGDNLRPQVDAALKPLRDEGLLWATLDGPGLRDLAADPQAQIALEAPAGACFTDSAGGPLVANLRAPEGNHGFLPFRGDLEASFIAWGPDIRAGVELHRIRMTAVAPTILKALGINDPGFGQQSALNIFRQ